MKFTYYTDIIHYSVPSVINEPLEDLDSRFLGCELVFFSFDTSEKLVGIVEDILGFSQDIGSIIFCV